MSISVRALLLCCATSAVASAVVPGAAPPLGALPSGGLGKPRIAGWRGGARGELHGGRPGGSVERRSSASQAPVHAAPEALRDLFVERVYRTLSVQIVATMLACWYMLTQQPGLLAGILRERAATLTVIFSPMLVAMTISSMPRLRKDPPWAYSLLALFTLCESLVLSLVMLYIPPPLMLIFRGPRWHSLYSAGGALAFAAMLVVRTQQIVGGSTGSDQHASISADEHVMASMLLYTDVVGLFINLLVAMDRNQGRRRSE
ncbi:hypothetical protein T492DRAFT_1052114 [Pavlovales sp. CCMP2436]|nr:hypothetical protein T492DRAFT_1052114 [Pavlovales sp. CCMP2436]